MSFCTVINCMDGRVQLPVINYLRERFGVEYVDSITEPGPNRIVGQQSDTPLLESILNRVTISVEKHNSVGLAIVAHYDCAGNPVDKPQQLDDLEQAVTFLRERFVKIPVVGLWVDETWTVSEVFPHK
ncbi:MAG: hypothetical protein KAR11_02635 [Phycisphaerae bacterium]|nr:hypothetical protein [Phycisphaerae bacterium]